MKRQIASAVFAVLLCLGSAAMATESIGVDPSAKPAAEPTKCAGDSCPPTPAVPAEVRNPFWLRKPSGEEFARLFPRLALQRDTEGRATIRCVVSASGMLQDCAVVSEDPAGMGFGDAAMRMAPLFKMSPHTRDGTPVEGVPIVIPISFRLPKGP